MLNDLLYRVRALVRRKGVEREMEEELRFHLERQVEKYVASGMDRSEAIRRARMEFGGVESVKEECREARGVRFFEDVWMDLRYALRTLRRNPIFLAVAVLSLGLGIGANSAIFSLIDALMLRSMPVQEPERLVQLELILSDGECCLSFSYQLYNYFRENSQSFTGILAAVRPTLFSEIAFKGAEEKVDVELVSGSYFVVLGLEPAAGRLINPSDDRAPGVSPVAVISYRYWKRRFGLDPGVIGKSFNLNGSAFTIIGVTPKEFFGTKAGSDTDVTFPLAMGRAVTGDDHWRHETRYFAYNFLSVMGRLKPGVSAQQAGAETRRLFESLLRQEASGMRGRDRNRILDQQIRLEPAAAGFNDLRWEFSEPLRVLMCIVALVLLLACANLSSLLLARAASRQREISIRQAIGAGRGRLTRQFLTESLLLALLGGAVGLVLGRWLSSALVAMMANGSTLALPTGYDWRVLVFTGTASLVTCLLVGLAPSLHAARPSVNPGLKEVRTGGHRHLGRALVVAQIAISLLLLVGASLFLGTLAELYRMDAGFRRDRILTFSVESKKKDSMARKHVLQREVVERLNALPGVTSSSVAVGLIISDGGWTGNVEVEGYQHRPDEDDQADFNAVEPRYFETMGTALLLGRDFNDRDVLSSKKVAIVSENFARYYFRDRSPLGQHVNQAEIVGVVKNAKYRNLREAFPKTVYLPLQQLDQPAGGEGSYLVHVSAGNPMRLVPQVERMIREIDPAWHVTEAQTFAEHVDRSILNERMMAALGGSFGLLALGIACLGVFGVMAFHVTRRMNELGVRMALGARRVDIIWLVLREVAAMLAAGSVIGCICALGLTRIARNMLFGVTPTEPAVYLLAIAVLSVAIFAAGYFPALRASRVDPMEALRHE